MPESDLDKKAAAVVNLARGWSTDRVGDAVGVSGRTVRRWRESPEFENEVRAARRAILDEAVAALGAAARDAVSTLHAAMDDESPGIRVQAARAVLAAMPALSEHLDLEERLAALEAATEERRAS